MRPWIVVPIYDEAPTIGAVVAGARGFAPVIVVDDGSSDEGARRARQAGADVVRHARRLGKGQALRTGLAAARRRGASHVVTLDGDGQHAPADVPVVLSAAERAPQAIVIGGRLGPGAPALEADRLNAIRLASFFVDWVSGLHVADTQSGFRVYPLAAIDRLPARHGGFVFETEILVLAAAAGVRVVEVPITAIPRAGRRSRFRPLIDGAAVGAYLAGRTLERWLLEARAAAAEVAQVFDRERRRARHAEMLAAGAGCAGSMAAWGTAITGVAVRHATARMRAWWEHPRRRRAAAGAVATLLAPAMVAVVGAQSLGLLPSSLTTLVNAIYGRVPEGALMEPGAIVERKSAAVPTR